MSNDRTSAPLEKRGARRVAPPVGTEAILNSEGITGLVKVKDISLGGMVICGDSTIEGFNKYSSIDDICISIPVNNAVINTQKHLFMGKGIIVRSFIDNTSEATCYAIKFNYDSVYLTQRLMTEIEEISPNYNK